MGQHLDPVRPFDLLGFTSTASRFFRSFLLIRSVGGGWIRIYAIYFTGKVMAK